MESYLGMVLDSMLCSTEYCRYVICYYVAVKMVERCLEYDRRDIQLYIFGMIEFKTTRFVNSR